MPKIPGAKMPKIDSMVMIAQAMAVCSGGLLVIFII
jgi:hypothetical protein